VDFDVCCLEDVRKGREKRERDRRDKEEGKERKGKERKGKKGKERKGGRGDQEKGAHLHYTKLSLLPQNVQTRKHRRRKFFFVPHVLFRDQY
jgi:hypothetical protein